MPGVEEKREQQPCVPRAACMAPGVGGLLSFTSARQNPVTVISGELEVLL